MSVNPIDENSTPKPTGSLEDLFRHHLGEEAAAPPRPVLWDQIDNALLVRQNETYRRRLVGTRWVAAASLLLATLAGTGWWSLRDARPGGPDLATTTRPATPSAPGSGPNATRSSAAQPATSAAANGARAAAAGAENSAPSANNLASSNPANPAPSGPGFASEPALAAGAAGRGTLAATGADSRDDLAAIERSAGRGTGSARSSSGSMGTPAAPLALADAVPHTAGGAQAAASLATSRQHEAAQTAAPTVAAAAGVAAASTVPAGSIGAGIAGAAPAEATALVAAAQVGSLASRAAALRLTAPAALPNGLAAAALPAEAGPAMASAVPRWSYGGSYAVGSFNPNINFSRAGIAPEFDYNPALGPDSPALTEAAAAQYRENLRPGLSQRIALLATRHLGGHWSLNTGVELSQATAKSASASAFLGEQLLDLGQGSTGPLRTTNFRYRFASLPLEMRYANSAKRGWSLYGRLGGVVSALLGARSEVEGSPESTRTYSIAGAAGPYRRVLGSVRGAAGAQFRPAAAGWALTLGPVAELGLVPLNAHPAQPYLAQHRPYSFGVEAGVEFGK